MATPLTAEQVEALRPELERQRLRDAQREARADLRTAVARCTENGLAPEDILRVVGATFGPSPR